MAAWRPFATSYRLMSSLPEYTELAMPALSPTMEVGTLSKWQKSEGEEIAAGDVLADVETDKAVVAFESVEEGYLAKILVAEGESDIPVGQTVAIMVENEADVAAFKDFKLEGSAPPKAEETSPPPSPQLEPKAEPKLEATPAPSATPSPAPTPTPAPAPQSAFVVEETAASSMEEHGDMEVVFDEW
eukprot:CAMPEP_0184488170 /NCGR_PEP_ID=MMETSP0113_2-20130426/10568_1 /TAXON_ID=91329 /ORGANISM="Norrisiella sphaerica, Strain BC52" /LENGTH=186 /DNA_ID=CAMNT_0026870661 /DNA_START=49 /DNA_END=606 /DNA_ORIENTATION=-